MRLLDFGGIQVAVQLECAAGSTLVDFVDLVGGLAGPEDHPDLVLTVRDGADATLVLDEQERIANLTIPPRCYPRRSAWAVQIALLQAAARCLGVVCRRDWVLLHGSTAKVDAADAVVAVLDGGRGQGKTSLAFGLARAGGLMADEFVFVDHRDGGLVTYPARRLPWHVRADMAAFLTPECSDARLVFASDLRPPPQPRPHRGELTVVLVPDVTLDAGDVERVEDPDTVERFLHQAATDHMAKLVDPRLDHVSIFESPAQITVPGSGRVDWAASELAPGRSPVLKHLAGLPVLRVGVGRPRDVVTTLRAVRRELRSL